MKEISALPTFQFFLFRVLGTFQLPTLPNQWRKKSGEKKRHPTTQCPRCRTLRGILRCHWSLERLGGRGKAQRSTGFCVFFGGIPWGCGLVLDGINRAFLIIQVGTNTVTQWKTTYMYIWNIEWNNYMIISLTQIPCLFLFVYDIQYQHVVSPVRLRKKYSWRCSRRGSYHHVCRAFPYGCFAPPAAAPFAPFKTWVKSSRNFPPQELPEVTDENFSLIKSHPGWFEFQPESVHRLTSYLHKDSEIKHQKSV